MKQKMIFLPINLNKYINFNILLLLFYNIKWGLGIGDWGLGIGDWAQ